MWTILRIRQLWTNVLLMLLEERLSTVLPECSLKFPVDLGLLNQTRGLFHIRFYVSCKWVMHYVSAAQICTAIMSGAHWLMCRKSERFVVNETDTTQGCLHRHDWWHFAPQFTAPSMGKKCDNDLHPPPPPSYPGKAESHDLLIKSIKPLSVRMSL